MSTEAKLDQILVRLRELDQILERLRELEAGQQRLEAGQQQLWAALNAHARRTTQRFDEVESSMDRGFARVQGQIQELLTRVERQDERADRLGRRITELESPKPEH